MIVLSLFFYVKENNQTFSVVELREDVEYQVQFDAGDKRMAIMVSLSPEFPLEKPVLRVSPPISHPWCNEHNEIISAPGLLNVNSIIKFLSLALKINVCFSYRTVHRTQRSRTSRASYHQRVQQKPTAIFRGKSAGFFDAESQRFAINAARSDL